MTSSVRGDLELRQYSDVEYVFVPHDNSLPPLREYIKAVWERRAFMRESAHADVASANAGTLLGGTWRLLDPLFQALIYWFLFTAIRGRGGSDYLLMVVSSVFLFTFTMNVWNEGGRSIQRSKGLVLNSTFPLATLPISTVYRAFLNLVPTLGIYFVIHLGLGGPVASSLLMLPFLLTLQVGISLGLALIFATLTVYIPDMSQLLNYITRVMLFVTPVIYPASQLDQLPGILHTILHLNPLFTLFSAYQQMFAGHVPDFNLVVQAMFWAVVLPLFGFRLFVSRERGFALRI